MGGRGGRSGMSSGGGTGTQEPRRTLISKNQVDELTRDFTPSMFLGNGFESTFIHSPNSLKEAADNYWDKLRIPASEKYAQAEGAARSLEGSMSAGTHAYDVVRTQGGKNNPELFSGGNWKTFRNDTGRSVNEDYAGYLKDRPSTTGGNQVLYNRMTSSAKAQLDKAIQTSAQKWLRNHPKPEHPRKDGYRWDGTKYVR